MEQMLIKDMKAVSGSLNVAVPVIYLSLEVTPELYTQYIHTQRQYRVSASRGSVVLCSRSCCRGRSWRRSFRLSVTSLDLICC